METVTVHENKVPCQRTQHTLTPAKARPHTIQFGSAGLALRPPHLSDTLLCVMIKMFCSIVLGKAFRQLTNSRKTFLYKEMFHYSIKRFEQFEIFTITIFKVGGVIDLC